MLLEDENLSCQSLVILVRILQEATSVFGLGFTLYCPILPISEQPLPSPRDYLTLGSKPPERIQLAMLVVFSSLLVGPQICFTIGALPR